MVPPWIPPVYAIGKGEKRKIVGVPTINVAILVGTTANFQREAKRLRCSSYNRAMTTTFSAHFIVFS
ncbi:hypothetical protein CH367_00430 [Leptospira barantonii]|uniref:Uncharacterized protein n=1 Tax=Leptospira barantonii TaxID=2023184 RepID=A0ABX4NP04_9LEPT|nr:hypothetical protein CH367_00430 [Leptospira barantonii]